MAEKSNQSNRVESVVNTIMGVRTEEQAQQRMAAAGNRADWRAIVTYVGGTLAQMGSMVLSLWGLQQINQELSDGVSIAVAISFFTLVAIRSRLFSPLNNARTRTTYSTVKRPDWAPPPPSVSHYLDEHWGFTSDFVLSRVAGTGAKLPVSTPGSLYDALGSGGYVEHYFYR